MEGWLIILLAVVVSLLSVRSEEQEAVLPDLNTAEDATSKGNVEYERLVLYSQMPRYGQCWTDVLTSLQVTCKELTETTQKSLGFKFANCFLGNSGLATFSCGKDRAITDCVTDAQAQRNFSTVYNLFFAHTENICFSQQLLNKPAVPTRNVASITKFRVASGPPAPASPGLPGSPGTNKIMGILTSLPDLLVGKECCGDLGCFGAFGDFWDLTLRPLNVFPLCKLATGRYLGLHLNTRANPNTTQVLFYSDIQTIAKSAFSAKKKTKILIHGFTDNINYPWWTNIVNELLKEGDYNVIRVDWSLGNTPPYTQASANIRLVGAYVGKFIEHVVTNYGASADDFHIIGHSLGAHGAGYVGSFLKEKKLILGRITGLDPAGPYYTGLPITVRLDPGDAKFVDTIISDGASIFVLAFGSQQPMGHINFYPNGGLNQPGCKSGSLLHGTTMDVTNFDWFGKTASLLLENVACSHSRAVSLFAESINNPLCAGSFECDSYENFQKGSCFSCKCDKCVSFDKCTRCVTFGYRVNTSMSTGNQPKKYFTLTKEKAPYCSRSYKLTFEQQKTTEKHAIATSGQVYVTLKGTTGVSAKIQLSSKIINISPGEIRSFAFPMPAPLGTLKNMVFMWKADDATIGTEKRFFQVKGDFLLTDENDNVIVFHPPKDLKVQDGEDVSMDADFNLTASRSPLSGRVSDCLDGRGVSSS